MKVTQDTPEHMILDELPWFWAGFMIVGSLIFATLGIVAIPDDAWIGVMFLAFSALWFGLMSLMVERVQLVMHRPSGQIALRKRSIWRFVEQLWPLEDVRALERETDDGTHRYVLVLTNGTWVPLTRSYTNVRRPRSVAQRASDWLDSARSDA